MPCAIEVSIETWFEKKKQISVNHFWTAVGRGVIMLAISAAFDWFGVVEHWWQAFLFSMAIHFASFNYLYNAITGRVWSYLRDAGIDGLLKETTPPHGVVFLQLWLLAVAAIIYFDPLSTIFAYLFK